eukprot:7053118-Prymnesium_polylepis.2
MCWLEDIQAWRLAHAAVVAATQVAARGRTQHFHVDVQREEWKLETLDDLLETLGSQSTLVYVRSRGAAEELSKQMSERGFTCCTVHAALEPKVRVGHGAVAGAVLCCS